MERGYVGMSIIYKNSTGDEGGMTNAEYEFIVSFNEMMKTVNKNSADHGFWEEVDVFKKICLIHCEVSEVVEALRKNDPPSTKIEGFSLAEEEWADALIRIMDLAQHLKLRLPEAILAKHAYNKTRPHKHGKEF